MMARIIVHPSWQRRASTGDIVRRFHALGFSVGNTRRYIEAKRVPVLHSVVAEILDFARRPQ